MSGTNRSRCNDQEMVETRYPNPPTRDVSRCVSQPGRRTLERVAHNCRRLPFSKKRIKSFRRPGHHAVASEVGVVGVHSRWLGDA